MGWKQLYAIAAAGTALTNTTTETVMAGTTLPAYHFQIGKRYRIRGTVRATATNSTDTLQVRLRIGTATLTGTVIVDGTAVDVANDNLVHFEVEGIVRAIGAGASGCTVAWTGFASIAGAEGTVTSRVAFEIDTTDSTVTNYVQITGAWSVASASNSAIAEAFTVDELVPGPA